MCETRSDTADRGQPVFTFDAFFHRPDLGQILKRYYQPGANVLLREKRRDVIPDTNGKAFGCDEVSFKTRKLIIVGNIDRHRDRLLDISEQREDRSAFYLVSRTAGDLG